MLIFFLIIICLFSSAGFDETFLNPWEREIDEKSCCHFGGVNYLKALIWVSFKLRPGYRTRQGWSLLNFSLLFYLNIGACMCAHVDVHVCTCICACVCLDIRRSDNNFAVASWVPFTLILLFNFYLLFLWKFHKSLQCLLISSITHVCSKCLSLHFPINFKFSFYNFIC